MLLIPGLIIGFSIAAPVGPIGVLCIRRSIRDGWFAGLISGLGAATADLLYGSVAAFGLKAVSDFMVQEQVWLRGFGGLFLIYLGARTFLTPPAEAEAAKGSAGLFSMYSTTFLLTLTNPLTILSFAAIFASISPANTDMTTLASIEMVTGVFLGSSAWWVLLSSASAYLKRKMSAEISQWIGRISGVIIMIFGILTLVSLFRT